MRDSYLVSDTGLPNILPWEVEQTFDVVPIYETRGFQDNIFRREE